MALAFSPALLTVLATRATGAEEGTGLTSFGETIEVRLINIEAVVTRGGERVEGLGPEDFELEVDGEQVPIEMFTEVRDGRAISGSPGLRSATVPSATLPAFPAGEVVPTWFLVFVDDYFSLPNRRDQVLRRLRQQLDRLGPDDRMALVAYDGQRLELLSSWSGSERELERALRRFVARRQRDVLMELRLAGTGVVAPSASSASRDGSRSASRPASMASASRAR